MQWRGIAVSPARRCEEPATPSVVARSLKGDEAIQPEDKSSAALDRFAGLRSTRDDRATKLRHHAVTAVLRSLQAEASLPAAPCVVARCPQGGEAIQPDDKPSAALDRFADLRSTRDDRAAKLRRHAVTAVLRSLQVEACLPAAPCVVARCPQGGEAIQPEDKSSAALDRFAALRSTRDDRAAKLRRHAVTAVLRSPLADAIQ